LPEHGFGFFKRCLANTRVVGQQTQSAEGQRAEKTEACFAGNGYSLVHRVQRAIMLTFFCINFCKKNLAPRQKASGTQLGGD